MLLGESVALPLWVRGRGGGRQTVVMLVRYKRVRPLGGEEGEAGEGVDDALFRCAFCTCFFFFCVSACRFACDFIVVLRIFIKVYFACFILF